MKDTLEILNLGGNHLTELPEEIVQFSKLRVLFLGSNDFVRIPCVLGRMSSLYMLSFKSNKVESIPEDCLSPSIGWLILTDNRLETLPRSIGGLSGLRKLMLANNHLVSLPAELARCRQLELVRLSRNRLVSFPDWLFELPRLSWLALSGNPASDISNIEIPNTINSSDLVVGEVIGQGASGFVHKVTSSVQKFDYDKSRFNGIAVKLFKGECGSDGHPSDEVYVSGRVGALNPYILPVLGCISERIGSSEDTANFISGIKYGLVFPLIPENCGVLAFPPSFTTVTRDVYAEGTIFSITRALKMLSGIASAGRYLHSRGIMHGDMYAHNLHVYEDGQPILVDFGAATAYGRFVSSSDQAGRSRYEALDVRAFGCLMEEIFGKVLTESVPPILVELKNQCLLDEASSRPSFEVIHSAFAAHNKLV